MSLGSWSTSCGGTVIGAGIAYPSSGEYESDRDCKWDIPKEAPFKLIFERFDLELSSGCSSDWVQIDKGHKMCGSKIPLAVTVEKSPVTVHFKSDHSVNKGGFMVRIVDGKSVYYFILSLFLFETAILFAKSRNTWKGEGAVKRLRKV